MTKDEALKLALEALENSQRFVEASANAKMLHGWGEQLDTAEDAIQAGRQAIKELESQEPVAHSVISGALFDFMGWLTSRKERIVLSSADNASPAVEAITEFARMRNLSLDDAKVQDWHTHPPQRTEPKVCCQQYDTCLEPCTPRGEHLAQRTWVGLMRGVRVEGNTVVITVKGGNDEARALCGELINKMEKNT